MVCPLATSPALQTTANDGLTRLRVPLDPRHQIDIERSDNDDAIHQRLETLTVRHHRSA